MVDTHMNKHIHPVIHSCCVCFLCDAPMSQILHKLCAEHFNLPHCKLAQTLCRALQLAIRNVELSRACLNQNAFEGQ